MRDKIKRGSLRFKGLVSGYCSAKSWTTFQVQGSAHLSRAVASVFPHVYDHTSPSSAPSLQKLLEGPSFAQNSAGTLVYASCENIVSMPYSPTSQKRMLVGESGGQVADRCDQEVWKQARNAQVCRLPTGRAARRGEELSSESPQVSATRQSLHKIHAPLEPGKRDRRERLPRMEETRKMSRRGVAGSHFRRSERCRSETPPGVSDSREKPLQRSREALAVVNFIPLSCFRLLHRTLGSR